MLTTIVGVTLIALGTCAAIVPLVIGSVVEHRSVTKKKKSTVRSAASAKAPQSQRDLAKAA